MRPIALALACTSKGTGTLWVVPAESGTTADSAAAPTDLDGDGWTVDAGDCDDGDIRASPGLEEMRGDAIDNDCDGSVDERFIGLSVVAYDPESKVALLHHIDPSGAIDRTVSLGTTLAPTGDLYLKPSLVPGVWIANDSNGLFLVEDETGRVTLVVDFATLSKGGEPEALYGVATDPVNGVYYVTTTDRLVEIHPDGTHAFVARWPRDHLATFDVTVDPRTSEVGMFGVFGGFATYRRGAGLQIEEYDDLEDGTPGAYAAGTTHRGGHYALAKSINADYGWGDGIYTWADGEVTPVLGYDSWWTSPPLTFAMEPERDDAFVLSYVDGVSAIWHLHADHTPENVIFESGGKGATSRLVGLAVREDFGP